MLGTTINREGIREDIDNRDYTYSPDRPVPVLTRVLAVSSRRTTVMLRRKS